MMCGPPTEIVYRETRQGRIAGGDVASRTEGVNYEPRKRRKTEKAFGTEQELYGLPIRWFMGPQLNQFVERDREAFLQVTGWSFITRSGHD
jgi:hypothetical protein